MPKGCLKSEQKEKNWVHNNEQNNAKKRRGVVGKGKGEDNGEEKY